MRVHIDDSELRKLEVDISGAPGRIQRNAHKVLVQASRMVNRGMREDASGHSGSWFGKGRYKLTELPTHVSHEMLDLWTAEIGIEYKGQGKLAHIIVFGSVNNAPVYDHTAALRRSTPAILRMFGDGAEDAVLGGEK